MTVAKKDSANLHQLLGLWLLCGGLLWLVVNVMRLHDAAAPWAGCVAIVATICLARFAARSFVVFDAVRDNWRLARGFKQRANVNRGGLGDLKDAATAGLLSGVGIMLGILNKRMLWYAGSSSGHVFAPARVGKSLFLAAILATWKAPPRFRGDRWIGSVVVVDLKGELAARTARAQKVLGRQVIYLNPIFLELNQSLRGDYPSTGYTGFGDLDPTSCDVKADLEGKFALLLPVTPDMDSKDKFFRAIGQRRGVMDGLGLLAAGQKVTFPDLLELAQLSGDAFLNHLARLEQSRAFGGALANMASRTFESYKSAPAMYEGGVEELVSVLSIYDRMGSLGQHTSKDEFDAAILTKKPYCLYIMLPTRLCESHAGWLNWVVATLIEGVAKAKSDRRVLFAIDEAVRLGKIANLDKATEFYSSSISVICLWQTVAAGVMIYTRDGFKKLIDNADWMISRAVRSSEELRTLSELIGKADYLDAARSLDAEQQKAEYRVDHKQRPVKDIADLFGLDEQQQILRYRNRVYICDAIDPRNDRRLEALLDPNPYHCHESEATGGP